MDNFEFMLIKIGVKIITINGPIIVSNKLLNSDIRLLIIFYSNNLSIKRKKWHKWSRVVHK